MFSLVRVGNGMSMPVSPLTQNATPPPIPTNVTGSATFSSQIILSWTVSTDDVRVAGYNVHGVAT